MKLYIFTESSVFLDIDFHIWSVCDGGINFTHVIKFVTHSGSFTIFQPFGGVVNLLIEHLLLDWLFPWARICSGDRRMVLSKLVGYFTEIFVQ